jgi:2-polyprenyl-3-methyl-5-hydroxy-6-metoxy-1,4-benzoquinol methylase
MAREEFENYGTIASQELSFTEMSGRYHSQVLSEKKILLDIVKKLKINPRDLLLEIGCGPGQILIPLSFLVSAATGVDHPKVCLALDRRVHLENLTLIPGNFLDVDFQGQSFDKILCYSVVSTLPAAELEDFVGKALTLLKPGGIMLLGDIANVDKKSRFIDSETGKKFESDWRERGLSSSNVDNTKIAIDANRLLVTDDVVLRLVGLVRKLGFHSFVLPQPEDLPWGHSREDILIIRPK